MTRLTTITVFFVLIVASVVAQAQISIGGNSHALRVQGAIGIGNGESTVSIINPNTQGSYTFLFPLIKPLDVGQAMPLRLYALGREGGQTLFVWKTDSSALASDVQTGPKQDESVTSSKYAVVNVDIPAMMSGTAQVVRLDIPGIKAGSAISVSPSDELPGMLAIAHASAPIDCVVIIKFINPGPFVPGQTMPMSIGAIGKSE